MLPVIAEADSRSFIANRILDFLLNFFRFYLEIPYLLNGGF